MKRKIIFLPILIFTSLACQTVMSVIEPTAQPTAAPLPTQPEPAQQPQVNLPPLTEDQVPRIPVDEAKAAVDSGAALLVDVRSVEAYKNGHAAGAITIPLEKFEFGTEKLSLEKDQWIITYCTWPNEHTSARAAFLLLNHGYTNVQALLGGLAAWTEAGYPLAPQQ